MIDLNNRAIKSLCYTILLLSPTVGFVLVAEVGDLVRLFPDDAFYYLQVAYHFVAHGVVSFDGVNLTNGVQPLQFLLSSLHALLVADKGDVLRLAVANNALWVILTAWISSRLLLSDLSEHQQRFGFVLLVLPIWYLYLWLDAGMEIGLVLFFGTLFYCFWERAYRHQFSSLNYNCALALVTALLLLSRLDTVIALPPFIVVALFSLIKYRVERNKILLPILVTLSLVLPYLIANQIVFGHVVPISGLVKSAGSPDFRANWQGLTSGNSVGNVIVVFPIVVSCAALVMVGEFKRKVSLLCLLFSALIYYTYIIFFASQVFRWYLAYPLVLQIIGISFLYHKFCLATSGSSQFWVFGLRLTTSLWGFSALLLFALFSQCMLYNWITTLNTTSAQLHRITKEINQLISSEDIMATYDAGVVGYFSEARVINLDGLANSYEYFNHYYLTRNFAEYFEQQGVSYFLVRKSHIVKPSDSVEMNYVFSSDERVRFGPSQLIKEFEIPQKFKLALFRL